MQKILLKDIVIPAGTLFSPAPVKVSRTDDEFFSCTIGLSANTAGDFTYGIDPDYLSELDEYFGDPQKVIDWKTTLWGTRISYDLGDGSSHWGMFIEVSTQYPDACNCLLDGAAVIVSYAMASLSLIDEE